MNAPRVALRAIRVGRTRVPVRSYASASSEKTSSAATGALSGGLIGGGTAIAVAYGWYHFSGAKTAVQTAHQAKDYVDSAINPVKLQLPKGDASASDALQTLRETANKYASFIPGGRQYVDAAFNDVDAIRKKHGDEVDKIVSEAYGELQDASSKGFTLETAGTVVTVLMKHMSRLSDLAGDAAGDILDQHPQLKEKVGGSVDQLKALGDKFGPDAKKQIEEARGKIRDITQNGFQADTIEKVQKLIKETVDQIRAGADKAFSQGLDELKPLLEKNPKIKQLVQDNEKALKDGNIGDVVNKIRKAVETGDLGDLQSYVEKAKQSGGQHLSQWFTSIPQGGQVLEQLQSLQKLAQSKGKEAEGLLKETIEEIKKVLENKVQKAEKIKDDAKKDVKKDN